MFRVKNVFENEHTVLLKLEGEIVESNVNDWSNWLESFSEQTNKQIILEFCHLIFVTQKGIEKLLEKMAPNIYLLNCPTDVENIAHAFGFSQNVLE